MREMPLSLAWFLGSVFMLAGLVGAWIVRGANRANAAMLLARREVQGILTRYDAGRSSDDWGRRGCAIEYTVNDQRYQIAAELNPDFYPLGQPIAVMVRIDQPSDGILRQELALRTLRWPTGIFLFGAAVLAWGYAEEWIVSGTGR